jgi:predicted dehydrogenase
VYRCAVLSALKHDYVARGVASHPAFEVAVVADEAEIADWAHERNQQLADAFKVPYVRDIDAVLREDDIHVAIVSPEGPRHCALSIQAARAGKHVVQDKPLATRRGDADALLAEVERAGVRFLMWNRNFLPAVQHAHRLVASGAVGRVRAVHVDFYFAKDAGPPRGSRGPGYPPLDWYAHQIAAHIDGSDGGLGKEPMGELAIEAIYPLGYVHLLTGGAAVHRVFARCAAHFHQLYADNKVEDLASISLEMDDVIGSVAVGRIGAASHPSGGAIKLHIVGSHGALVIDESSPGVGLCYRGQPPKEPRRRRVGNDNDFRLADDLARAIEEGRPTCLDIRASHGIYSTVEAALRSAAEGRAVTVE